ILLVTDKTANGDPIGIAPDMGKLLADRLGVGVKYITYATPGEVADAAERDEWDVGLIAVEPKRAEVIAFCDPYVEIEATYLVPEDSSFQSVDDVDAPGVKIAVSERAAYDLYLTRTLKHATLHRAEGLPGAVALYATGDYDALAGLVPALRENAAQLPGSRLIPGRYTAVQQAVGTRHGKPALNAEVQAFLAQVKGDGTVQKLIDKHGVTGKLEVAKDA
ncbi:MAG: transporter substrate-binding domain-containing protein, partial [Rhodospirillaceae bacterium]